LLYLYIRILLCFIYILGNRFGVFPFETMDSMLPVSVFAKNF
jgi:hypothetical protein